MITVRHLIGIACISLFSAGIFAAPPEHDARQTIAPGYQQLLNRAQDEGQVRILVRYKVDAAHSYATGQQKALARVQGLASRLNLTALKSLKRYPIQAYEVNPGQLDAMLDSGLFEQVAEDGLNYPQLQQSIALIDGGLAHNFGFTGNGAAVAILDTGVESSHPAFGGRVVEEACFSTRSRRYGSTSLCPNGKSSQIGPGAAEPCSGKCSHGTHVASIAAGQHDTNPGVAPDAGIIAVQVFSRFNKESVCGTGVTDCVLAFDADVLEALEHVLTLSASYTVAAVNLSLGGGRYTAACDSSFYKPFVDDLAAAGVMTVAASGNNGFSDSMIAPACVSTVFSVGSVGDVNDTVNGWSNSASFLDILAPGGNIYAAVPGGYATKSGTSMATPHVAGAVALVKAASPTLDVAGIKSLLTSEASTVVDSRNGLSFPRLDLGAVTEFLAGPGEMPAVSITSPADSAVIAVDEGPVVLMADASDPQDGDLSSAVAWNSDIDGVLLSQVQLSVGQHAIQAQVADSVGFTAEDSVVVHVANKPAVQILSPDDGAELVQGQVHVLSGQAGDVEDGDISSSVSWTSSLDGALGSGASVSSSLSVGTHKITATVQDSDGHTPSSAAEITVTVLADTDGDGVPNATDNCPNNANPGQDDIDNDGKGDICDTGGGC